MKMSIKLLKFLVGNLTLLFFITSSMALAVQGTDYVAPPRYSTIDKFGVNVLGGRVTADLQTVSIGGDMGLIHSISPRTNLFTYSGNYGYNDRYAGGLKRIELGQHVALVNGGPTMFLVVMQASALGDSANFIVMRDGVYAPSGTGYTSNYEYEALGDKRHTLGPKNGELVWTKPDGTEVYFGASGGAAGMNRSFQKIVYPNGFTINVHYTTGVTTNTGYQLKYDYINDDPGLEASKRGRRFGQYANVPSESLSESANWRIKNPKYVRAINNAYEYCPPTQKEPCDLSNSWPFATFNWPGGMPRAIFIDTTIFSVENAEGAVTEFHYEAHDAALKTLKDPTTLIDGYTLNTRIAPRLIAIKPAAATESTVSFTYKNQIDIVSVGNGNHPTLKTEEGELVTARGILGIGGYDSAAIAPGNAPMHYSGSQLRVIEHRTIPTALDKVYLDGEQRILSFEANYRNFVMTDGNRNSPSRGFKYNAGNNLWQVTYPDNNGEAVAWEAGYPPSCIAPTADRNRKTCNKPLWVKDPKGNVTNYTYHAESGQVATITYPTNVSGVRPQTRYKYEQKYASYYVAANNKEQSDTPVWLNTEESYCVNSAANTDGSCSGNDAVITRYEYEHDNLLMTGKTVFSQVDNKTLRTCYQYDRYGNRIGEIQPKANLTSCN